MKENSRKKNRKFRKEKASVPVSLRKTLILRERKQERETGGVVEEALFTYVNV